MIHWSLPVLLMLWPAGTTLAEEPEYTGWKLHSLRAQAFAGVKTSRQVSKFFPASQKIVKSPPLKRETQPDGTTHVTYPSRQIAVYDAAGKTRAVGFVDQDRFPQQIAFYEYPSGELQRVVLRISPLDVFVFDRTGNLTEGNLESAFWERPTLEKKVTAIGQQLLSANRIKEKIMFQVVPDRQEPHASASEMNNRVVVSKGLLAYVDSDDEIAAVLAHEVAHIILRHRHIYPRPTHDEELQARLRIPVELRRDTYEFAQSQEKELDADRMGLRMMIMAGYDPQGMIRILQKITSDGSEADWSTHPSGSYRIQAIERQIRSMAFSEPAKTSNIESFSSIPAHKANLGSWTWHRAQAEVLKALKSSRSSEPLTSFPAQDPDYSRHRTAMESGRAVPGATLVSESATGIYALLLKDSRIGPRRYAVLYPTVRAYMVYGWNGQSSHAAICNQAALPRVCQWRRPDDGHLERITFEVSETDAFLFDAAGNLAGYRTNQGLYNLDGKPTGTVQRVGP